MQTRSETVIETSKEAKTIAKKLDLDDRIEYQSDQAAYITIKAHKENVPNQIKCRLINLAKIQICRISKQIL